MKNFEFDRLLHFLNVLARQKRVLSVIDCRILLQQRIFIVGLSICLKPQDLFVCLFFK